jgi:glycerol kinase
VALCHLHHAGQIVQARREQIAGAGEEAPEREQAACWPNSGVAADDMPSPAFSLYSPAAFSHNPLSVNALRGRHSGCERTKDTLHDGRYILALDQGTTSSRSILFTHDGRNRASAQQEFAQIFPAPGHVEHDPEAIWKTQLATARRVLRDAKAKAEQVAAIGITNQRETVVLWDRDSGRPVHNAIVWQSRITAGLCDRLRNDGLEPLFRKKTGLVLDAYFSGTKVKHLLDRDRSLRRRAEKGEILLGTIDTFLLWRLTGGKVHATDYSNASRTLLFNINTLDWDDELLKILGVPRAMLPEVRPSSGEFGATDPKLFGRSIPIAGVAGDQQAATFGQACFKKGMVKNTYGTGCFLLMNTGEQARHLKERAADHDRLGN